MNKNFRRLQHNCQYPQKQKKTQKFNNMFQTNRKQNQISHKQQHKDQSLLDQFQYNTNLANYHNFIHKTMPSKKLSSDSSQKYQTMHLIYSNNFQDDQLQHSPNENSQFDNVNYVTSSYSNQSSQIVDHLIQQNKNLKDHNSFLIQQVRRHRQKFKKYKIQIKQYLRKIQQLEHQNDVYKLQYLTVKQYVYQSLQKVQQQGQSLQYPRYIQQVSSNLKREQQDQPSTKFQRVNSVNTIGYKPSKNLNQQDINQNYSYQNQSNQMISTQPSKSIDALIDQLNDQFDAMMYQYKSTKNVESRRKCMEIAKQIKQLKKTQKQTIHQKKIQIQNSKNVTLPPHPNPSISRKTLAYPSNKNQLIKNESFENNISKTNTHFKFRSSDTQNNMFKYLPNKFGASSKTQYL